MKLWLTAAGLLVANGSVFALPYPAPQGQGSSTPPLVTNSYEMVILGSASGVSQTASLGASYGRFEEVGVDQLTPNSLSIETGLYLAGSSWTLDLNEPFTFHLLAPAPHAGFSSTEVVVPVTDMSGPISIRFDGILAAPLPGNTSDYAKVTAPSHASGPVDVTVDSPAKTTTFECGFAYIPAISAPAEVSTGQRLQLRMSGGPGSHFWVLYSDSLGVPTSVPGIDGSLDLDFSTLTALGEAVVPPSLPGGASTTDAFLEFELPESAVLAGKTYFVQAAALDSTLPNSQTAFTNHLAITVK